MKTSLLVGWGNISNNIKDAFVTGFVKVFGIVLSRALLVIKMVPRQARQAPTLDQMTHMAWHLASTTIVESFALRIGHSVSRRLRKRPHRLDNRHHGSREEFTELT